MNLFYVVLLICGVSHVLASKDAYERFKQRVNLFFNPVDNGDPIANSFGGRWFRLAVHWGDIESACHVFGVASDELEKYCVKHLNTLESSKLGELINDAKDYTKPRWLRVLLIVADRSLLDKIFNVLNPSNNLLSRVANSTYLACMPQRFIYLLGKIGNKDEQEEAVRRGVSALVEEDTSECLDPLLSALGEDLANVAIREAFWSACDYQDGRTVFAKCFFDNSVVTAEDYSIALYRSYDWGVVKPKSSFTGC